MQPIVILFSGQGAQKVGMAKDWLDSSSTARQMATLADTTLGFSLSQIMTEGEDEELTRTSRCQPALYLHGLIALTLLKERLPAINIAATAGLSLGEFTAHAAAGTFGFEEGLKLVAKRGALMETACQSTQGHMLALLGGEVEQIQALAKECDVDIANFNAPGQIVLSGSVDGIKTAANAAKTFGVRRAIELNVAGAYHSRLMQSAQDQLAIELANVAILEPQIPVVCNFEATPVTDAAMIRHTLEKQVTGSVRWTESIEYLIAQGHHTFIELGPGKVLAGLVAKINKEVTVYSIEDQASLEATIQALS